MNVAAPRPMSGAPPVPKPSHHAAAPGAYRFVDYATQIYTAFVACLLLLFHNGNVPAWPWLVLGHMVLMCSIHAVIKTAAHPSTPKFLRFLRDYYPILLYTAFFCEAGRINRMFFSEYLDPVLIHWEQFLLGFQPSVAFMQKLPYLLVSEVFYAAYFSYYIMIAGVGLALLLRNKAHFLHFVSVVSFVFYMCYATYVFLPVIGPRVFRYHIPGFTLPESMRHLVPPEPYPEAITVGPFYQIMRWIYDVFEAPGSALPSSHVAIALTTVYFSFLYVRKIRFIHLAAAILLCLSTMYCGYHYLIDVVAGALTAIILVPTGNWLHLKFSEPPATPSGKQALTDVTEKTDSGRIT
jgi:membrane-associated phospholipid phosphatase